MNKTRHGLLLADLLTAAWSLFALVQMLLQGAVTLNSSFFFLLLLICYWTGRFLDRMDIVIKIFTVLVILVAALCLFYLFYDISVFQYPTLVSFNSSAVAIELAVAASCCFAIGKKQKSLFIKVTLGLAAAIFIVLIVLLKSRTALISLTAGVFYVAFPGLGNWRARKRLFVFSGILFLLAMVLALMIKLDSSIGRWFIWKISWHLLQQNWATGIGIGLFNRHYNHLQADYFLHHSLNGHEAMLADDGYYAFNEWLNVGVEQGMIGLFLFLVLTFCVLRACYKQNDDENTLPGSALIPIFIACFFSYPLHVPLIVSAAAFFCGIICSRSSVIGHITLPRYLITSCWFTFFLIVCFIGFLNNYSLAAFKKARELKEEGAKTKAYNLAEQQSTTLRAHPSFSMFYLELLYETGRVREAINWFNTMHAFQCNQRAHAIVGKCYAEMGRLGQAEENLQMSLYITPHLLQSRMDLLHFYDQAGDTIKAKLWANEIINYAPKIKSVKACLLKEEAAKYLIRNWNEK